MKEQIKPELNSEKQKTIEALDKYFEPSEEVTAQHVLYNDFVKEHGNIVNKFIMYMLFQAGWGNPTGKAECGSLGFHKKVKLKGVNTNG